MATRNIVKILITLRELKEKAMSKLAKNRPRSKNGKGSLGMQSDSWD